ncbi:MAG: DNA repair protein RecO [Bacteroidales bacterium]
MFYKTNGVILHTIKYNDKASIVHIFTELFGIIAFNIPNTRSKRSSVKRNIFQPLTIVDLEIEHKPNRELQRIKEVRISTPLSSIHTNPVKTAIAILLTEIIEKFVTKNTQQQSLYTFLESAVQVLDLTESGYGNFHLIFIIKLTKFIGFAYNLNDWHSGDWFNIENGMLQSSKPTSPLLLTQYDTELLYRLSTLDFRDMSQLPINREDRNSVLDGLIEYLKYHINPKIELKSPEIVKSLFE